MSKKKIFVIDDEPEIVRFVEKVLTRSGYKVDSSTSPLEALERIRQGSYNVLITDIKMPEISGIEIIEKVKKMNLPNPIEIVVITAHATVDTAVECMRAGALDYLIKPFEIKEILATVEKAVAAQELKSRLVSMEEMDRLKDEFISTATHELKTPLMAISGAAELLGMTTLSEGSSGVAVSEGTEANLSKNTSSVTAPSPERLEEIKKFVDIVLRQSNKMKLLVEDLLDTARIDAKRMPINKTLVNIDALIKEAIEELQPLARNKNISIDYKGAEGIIIHCDYRQIKRVLNNLIANAIKYTHQSDTISITLSSPDGSDRVAVSVHDNGKGLKEEDLERIFEKFYRVDQSLTREEGGFGLGLSIAKRIVELHGGRIWAESDGLGKGTTVTFTLPYSKR